MSLIKVGSFEFSIMPETAAWSYSMKINSIDTYGGRVVQFLNSSIDSLFVEGYIRPKRTGVSAGPQPYVGYDLDQWQGMREFEYNVKQIMLYHERSKSPVHFSFPEVGWDGMVFLTGYSDVRYDPGTPAVMYKLSFDIDSGFDSVMYSADSHGLENIPSGVGWVRSIYNTPQVGDWERAKKAVEKVVDDAGSFSASKPLDFYQYLMEVDENAEDGATAEEVAATAVGALAGSAAPYSSSQDAKYVSSGISSVRDGAQQVIENSLVAFGLTSDWSS